MWFWQLPKIEKKEEMKYTTHLSWGKPGTVLKQVTIPLWEVTAATLAAHMLMAKL